MESVQRKEILNEGKTWPEFFVALASTVWLRYVRLLFLTGPYREEHMKKVQVGCLLKLLHSPGFFDFLPA